MTPKQFIKQVFINELNKIKDSNPYIAFAIMAIGIEFLGKCLDTDNQNWNTPRKSKYHFELAIKKLSSLKIYKQYLNNYALWNSLRNGFAHSFVPKNTLSLSSKNERAHLSKHNNGLTINLKCEDFYEDFKNACSEVIQKEFKNEDKMNKNLLSLPQDYNK
jgi:hypothetical protein